MVYHVACLGASRPAQLLLGLVAAMPTQRVPAGTGT